MGKEKEVIVSFPSIQVWSCLKNSVTILKCFPWQETICPLKDFWISFWSCVLIHNIDGIPRSQQLSCNLQNKLKIYSYNKDRQYVYYSSRIQLKFSILALKSSFYLAQICQIKRRQDVYITMSLSIFFPCFYVHIRFH